MVKTRSDLKIKIKEEIRTINRPFRTTEIVEFANKIAPNVWNSPHRISKYIKAADIANFNNSKKQWEIKTKPKRGISNANKRSSSL